MPSGTALWRRPGSRRAAGRYCGCLLYTSTGDELLPLEKEPVPGKIYDSNGVMICARLRELGAEADLHPIKGDAPGELAAATERLLQEYPLVITTGGVSVGDRDYMPAVAEMVRARILSVSYTHLCTVPARIISRQ